MATLGKVLIIGGSGFLGSYLVQHFHRAGATVCVASKSPAKLFDFVTYHSVDITNEQDLRKLLAEIQPGLILHVAVPHPSASPRTQNDCNVKGTSNILRCAAENQHVQAFIYTSSIRAIASTPSTKAWSEEESQLWNESSNIDAYAKTKAIGERISLEANGPNLKTAVVRMPNVYGGRDHVMDSAMESLQTGRKEMQIGDNHALFEFCAIENAVEGHLLVAKALLAKPEGVAGEAFNITDDNPLPWWDFNRSVYAAAGQPADMTKIKIVPMWLLIPIAYIVDWASWAITFGKSQSLFNPSNMRFIRDGNPLMDISKARERLGYEPKMSTDDGIKKAVHRATSGDRTL